VGAPPVSGGRARVGLGGGGTAVGTGDGATEDGAGGVDDEEEEDVSGRVMVVNTDGWPLN
jgi:hypothetical protein